jgi:hypothetical protein
MVSIGFIVGSMICKSMQGHLAYATENYDCKKFPADCDPVLPPPTTNDSFPTHRGFPKGFKQKCGPLTLPNGKVITVCNITDPYNMAKGSDNQITPIVPEDGLDPDSDPLHPSRGKDEKGYAILPRKRFLEYPAFDPDDPNNPGGKNKSPLIQTEGIPISQSDPSSIHSEYARAYAVEDDPSKDPNLTPAQRAYAKMMIEKNARESGVTPDELLQQQDDRPRELQSRFGCGFYTLFNGRKIKICKDNPLFDDKAATGDIHLIPQVDSHGRIVRSGDPLHPHSIAPPGDVVGLDYPIQTNQTLGVAPAGIKAYPDSYSTYARAYAVQQMQQQITLA